MVNMDNTAEEIYKQFGLKHQNLLIFDAERLEEEYNQFVKAWTKGISNNG